MNRALAITVCIGGLSVFGGLFFMAGANHTVAEQKTTTASSAPSATVSEDLPPLGKHDADIAAAILAASDIVQETMNMLDDMTAVGNAGMTRAFNRNDANITELANKGTAAIETLHAIRMGKQPGNVTDALVVILNIQADLLRELNNTLEGMMIFDDDNTARVRHRHAPRLHQLDAQFKTAAKTLN
jgi:hypothetical protein